MVRLQSIADLAQVGKPLHLALGVFDGVHLGHRAVIGAMVEGSRKSGGMAGVLTFEPHPIQVLAPDRAPRRILATLGHKELLLRDLGVEVLVVVPFTRAFAERPAREFASELLGAPGLRQVSMGEDWKFGRGRTGTVELLRTIGHEAGVEVITAAPVMLDGERISSTRIRQALRDGNLGAAAAMLGRPYSVFGAVARGEQLGTQLGAPTANIEVGNEQLPPDAVYATLTFAAGEWRPGVANLGVRPTVDGKRRLLEVHLFDFEGDLYGQDVEVRFGRRLRGEQTFEDLEALRAQIARDVENGRRLFEEGAAMNARGEG